MVARPRAVLAEVGADDTAPAPERRPPPPLEPPEPLPPDPSDPPYRSRCPGFLALTWRNRLQSLFGWFSAACRLFVSRYAGCRARRRFSAAICAAASRLARSACFSSFCRASRLADWPLAADLVRGFRQQLVSLGGLPPQPAPRVSLRFWTGDRLSEDLPHADCGEGWVLDSSTACRSLEPAPCEWSTVHS